jgi:hypothetical protein
MTRTEDNAKNDARREALALRHVMLQDPAERLLAARKLDACCMELIQTAGALARELETAPGMTLADLGAMINNRPALKTESEKVEDATCLDPGAAHDPEKARHAFEGVLLNQEDRQFRTRLAEAEKMLEHARTWDKTREERRRSARDAAHELMRAESLEMPLADLWEAHRADMAAGAAKPKEAVQLDEGSRGGWARWFNAHLGPRNGLTPGRTLLLGGSAAAGKTSLAAALAVDAMAAGCPVLMWQLELGTGETLEHLMAQRTEPARWWARKYEERCNGPLPAAWKDLLTVPHYADEKAAEYETIRDALAAHALRARRRGGHACNGVVFVDYMQLLTLSDRAAKDSQHEVLATAASRLARAAADHGAVLVLLSQITKDAQRQKESRAMTSYMGADLARMAHCACNIWRARADGANFVPCAANDEPAYEPGQGEARLLTFTKTRGWYKPAGGKRPKPDQVAWYNERALHGGEDDQAKRRIDEGI